MRVHILLVALLLVPCVVRADPPTLPRELVLEQQVLDLQRQVVALEKRAAEAEATAAQVVVAIVADRGKVRQADFDAAQMALDQKKVTALGGDWSKGDRLNQDGTVKHAPPESTK